MVVFIMSVDHVSVYLIGVIKKEVDTSFFCAILEYVKGVCYEKNIVNIGYIIGMFRLF